MGWSIALLLAKINFIKNGCTKKQRFGKPKSLLFKYMLATSSCMYAGFRCELQLAVSNYSTYMLELAAKDRNTSEHPI